MKASDLPGFAEAQRSLLAAALGRVRPGGRCVYSTCSVEPEENAAVVAAVLTDARFAGWRCARSTLHRPGRPGDGGFQALLVS